MRIVTISSNIFCLIKRTLSAWLWSGILTIQTFEVRIISALLCFKTPWKKENDVGQILVSCLLWCKYCWVCIKNTIMVDWDLAQLCFNIEQTNKRCVYLQNSWCSSSSCSWVPSASQCGHDHLPSGVSSSSGSKQTRWYARGQVSHSMISPPCWHTSQ